MHCPCHWWWLHIMMMMLLKIQEYKNTNIDTHTNPPNSRHQWWWWWKCCCSKSKKNIIFVFYNTQCSLMYLVWIVCTALCIVQWLLISAQGNALRLRWSECSMHLALQCALHCGVQCAVCSSVCAALRWRWVVCSAQCAVCSVQCAVCSVQCIAVAVGVIQWRGLDHIPGSGDIWAGNQSQGWGGKTFGGVVIRPGSRGGYIFGGWVDIKSVTTYESPYFTKNACWVHYNIEYLGQEGSFGGAGLEKSGDNPGFWF